MRIDKTTLKKQSGLYTDHPMVETYTGFSGNSVSNIARDCLVSGVIVEAAEKMNDDYDGSKSTIYEAKPVYSDDQTGNKIPVIRPKGVPIDPGDRGILVETHDKLDTFLPFNYSFGLDISILEITPISPQLSHSDGCTEELTVKIYVEDTKTEEPAENIDVIVYLVGGEMVEFPAPVQTDANGEATISVTTTTSGHMLVKARIVGGNAYAYQPINVLNDPDGLCPLIYQTLDVTSDVGGTVSFDVEYPDGSTASGFGEGTHTFEKGTKITSTSVTVEDPDTQGSNDLGDFAKYEFKAWEGDQESGSESINFTLDTDMEINAVFSLVGEGNGEDIIVSETNGEWQMLAAPTNPSLLLYEGSSVAYTQWDSTLGISGGFFGLHHLGLEFLSDPDNDRIIFWDESADSTKWLSAGSGLVFNDTDIDVQTGTGITISNDSVELNHLGIENLSDPGNDRILFWNESTNTTDWLSTGPLIDINGSTIEFNWSDITGYDSSKDQVLVNNQGTMKFIDLSDFSCP